MFEKVKEFVFKNKRTLAKLTKRMANPIRVLAISYASIIILIILTMYAMCLTSWVYGKEVFTWLLQLLEKCVSMPFVAALVFLGGCFIDSDGDGTPDSFDKVNDKPKEDKNIDCIDHQNILQRKEF